MNKVFLFYTLSLLVISISQQVDALKCWRCSSDASAFCDDPFDPSVVSEQQHRWAFVDCNFPPSNKQPYGLQQTSRAVCKKMKQLVDEKVVVSRSCSWEGFNTPANNCMRTTTPSYITTEFCETCEHDGCNRASKLTGAIVLALTAIMIFVLNL